MGVLSETFQRQTWNIGGQQSDGRPWCLNGDPADTVQRRRMPSWGPIEDWNALIYSMPNAS